MPDPAVLTSVAGGDSGHGPWDARSAARALRAWSAVHEGLMPLGGAAVVAVLSWLGAGNGLESFLIVDFTQTVPLTLLVPLAAGFLVGLSSCYAATDFAAASPRRLRWWRATWVAMQIALYAAAANVSCMVDDCQGALVTRNVVVFAALALLGVSAFGSGIGWLPLAVYAICFLVFGQRAFGEGDLVRFWAFPLDHDFSFAQAVVCVAVAAAALGVYARWGARPTDARLRGARVP